MLIKWLFGSVFKGSAKRFPAHLCLIGSNLDVTCTALSFAVMILTGNHVAGNAGNNALI